MVKAATQAAAAKRGEQSFDVLALRAALGSSMKGSGPSKESQQPKPVRKNKAKKNTAAREVAQLNAVLSHSVFQANPIETIKEHLQNTVKPAGGGV